MEVGRISSHNNLETTTLLENLGGCCEGTVFTFTSASSKWRLRQRLNRNKASLLNPHGVPILFGEDPTDSVFTEIRMMPINSQTNSSYDVDIWNCNKWSLPNGSEGHSRVNNTTYHDVGDLRCYHTMGKLTSQLGGDQTIKVVPKEVETMDHDRKKLQVFKEETTPQKNRRYLRCDHFRDGHKYRDIGVDNKTCIWNEKKLEEVSAQEEKRRNKRESCTEEIYNFEQRKVKCRRRDQDSCSSRSESMQSYDICKARDVRQASYGFNNKQGVVEEPKKQQLGHNLAINTYVADESTKNQRGSSIEIVNQIEDKCLNHLPKQKPLQSQIHNKFGNATKENRLCTTPQPKVEPPSTPPLACSFISFKAGVPCMQSRRWLNPLGDASLRSMKITSLDTQGDGVTSFDLKGPHNTNLEMSPNCLFKSRHASINDEESAAQMINNSHLHAQGMKKSCDRFLPRPLDWHESSELEDELQTTNPDDNDLKSNDKDNDNEFSSRQATNEPCPTQECVESCDDISEHSLDEIQSLEVKDYESCGIPNKYVYDGNARIEDKVPNAIAKGLLQSKTLEVETQSSKEAKTNILDGKSSINSSSNSMFETFTKIVDVDRLPQKSVPLECKAWVTGFKRKTRERVGYFDYWLGRGKKDLSSRKPNKTSPSKKSGPNGAGELSQAIEPKLDNELDKPDTLTNSIDQHLISQDWSKKETQAYVTKEFKILDAVLQSEVLLDADEPKVEDYSQKTSIKSNVVLGKIVDEMVERRQERGTMTRQANSQTLNNIDMNTVSTDLEIDDELAQTRCIVGRDSSFHCGEQELSHVVGLSNNNLGQARECKQTVEGREDPLTCKKSSTNEVNVGHERDSLQFQDLHEYNVMSKEGFNNSLERSKNMEVFSQNQDTLPCTRDAQGPGIVEQCRFIFEKRCESQENKLARADAKPVIQLAVLNDSRDIPTHTLLDRSDVAIGERSMRSNFGALATKLSDLATHTCMSQMETEQFHPSNLTIGFGNCSKAMDSLVQIEKLDFYPVNAAPTTFSQPTSSPIQESSVANISMHGKEVKRPSIQELRSPNTSKSSQVMVGYKGNGECTNESFSHSKDMLDFRNGLIESNTTSNGVGQECSFATFKSKIDVDKFPSSLDIPIGKEISEMDKMKETSLNRRQKMPIIVRVRNRLASGWLLRPSLWKRIGKQKMKTCESQVFTTKYTNKKEIQVDPSQMSYGQASTLNPLTCLHESKIENVIKLEAQHKACDASEKENLHQNSLGDLDLCKFYRRIDDCSKMFAVGEQNDVNRTLSPPVENYDEPEKDHMTNHECLDLESSVLSFAEWESRATRFMNSSPSKNKLGANSVVLGTNNRETKPEKSNEFNDVEELLSGVCLGYSAKEPTVLGTFSEFDPGGQKLIRHVCPTKREKMTAVSKKFSACSVNGSVIDSDSEAMKSGFCQTEALSKADAHKKKQTDIPMDSPANTSSDCCPDVGEEGAEIEESQECESAQKFFSFNDRNEDLQTCFSASLDDGCEGPPFIHGRMHTPGHIADSIDEQPHVDGQSDDKYFIPQVEDLLDCVSIEPTLDESARPTSQERQLRQGKADEERQRPLPDFVQPFEPARVVDPFCLPLQVAHSGGKELVLGDGPEKGREMEEYRRSSPKVIAMQEEDQPTSCLFCSLTDKSPGDLKHWELMEMVKMPNHQKQLWHGRKLKILSSEDNQEHAYRTEKQTNAWESSSQKDCGRTRGTLRWKDVPKNQSASDLSTEEQVFLERFSATSNDLKPCKLPPQSASSHLGVEALGQSCCPFSPDLGTQMRLFSAPARLNCGRTESISLGRNVEPAPLASDAHLIKSLPPCGSTRSSLSEARRPDSSQEYKHERSNAFESRLLPDYAPSLDGLSPSSSICRSLDMSERLFTKGCPCADCLKKYEHREAACVQGGGADGVYDWMSSETQEFPPSMTMHGSTFPAQCQSLLLNPRQSFCPIHASQSSTQCRCDPWNSCRYSPPFLQSCHHPSCIAPVQLPSQCPFPGHSRSLPVSFNEPGMFQNTGAPYRRGPNVQYPKKDTVHPYSPMPVIQPSATPAPRPRSRGDSQQPLFPHERHCADKNSRATQNCQLGGQSQSNQTKGTESEKGLVWLSEQEMNLIQQLRLSSEKEVAGVCRHDAAAVIQRNWRRYLEKKAEEDLKVEDGPQVAFSLTEYPMWHDHFQYCKLLPAAMSIQLSESSPKDLSHQNLVRRWYTTMQKAASVIQRAWRSILRNRKETLLTRREWPKDLKTLYDIIKSRLVKRGHPAPSFGLFSKSVERIQAATEGARVRRRLKSHRLQTIVLEIKEIRMLLYEMSQEEKSTSTPFLFPQLCTQLQQKISQLHAALNGKQMEPRYLLRRCAATPMTIHSLRSTSPKSVYMVPSQKSMNQSLAKLSSGAVEARKFYSPPLTNPASAVPPNQNFIQTQSFVPLMQGSKGNAIRLRNSSPDAPDSADPPDSAKLLQLYFLAQRSPSKSIGGRGTPDSDSTRGHEPNVKKVFESQKRFSSQKASPKSKDPEYSFNNSFDEQPLPVPQRRKIPEMSLEEMALGESNANMYLTEYAPSTDLTDKPKRPFLKRKSIAMPSQKLDWSKVKPMVSSRLEPELKTKLSFRKGPTKEPAKVTSKKKKANYSNVKSRLFSYEENVSPSNSGDETYLRSHTTETPSDSGYPPMLRNSAKGSSIEGSENGRYSRVPPNRQRTVSPDLMHLRRSMAEADRLSSQNSMLEKRNVAAYNSNFDSARYLHKLGHNSEQASKGTLTGSRQQRTQRSIRLRILPGSKESPVGDLFVQEEMQEIWEDQSHSPADGKGKREQSHSHRYAIYQEEDGRYSSRVSERTRPPSAEEDGRVTATSSREDIQDSLRHEVYKYFETK